jgi:hypothetical protein
MERSLAGHFSRTDPARSLPVKPDRKHIGCPLIWPENPLATSLVRLCEMLLPAKGCPIKFGSCFVAGLLPYFS